MPLYVYKCCECGIIEELKHSIGEIMEVLSCGHDKIEKIPTNSINVMKQRKEGLDKKVGDLVKETIESTKEEIRKEKQDASKRMWENK